MSDWERKQVLTNKDLEQVGRRWWMCVENFNYETQLAGSVAYAVEPALRKIYPDDDEFVEALDNHFNYFNTMPWLANLVLGAALAVEDSRGLEGKDTVQNLKVSLMGPLAGIGDSLIVVMLPTIFGSIGGALALEGIQWDDRLADRIHYLYIIETETGSSWLSWRYGPVKYIRK